MDIGVIPADCAGSSVCGFNGFVFEVTLAVIRRSRHGITRCPTSDCSTPRGPTSDCSDLSVVNRLARAIVDALAQILAGLEVRHVLARERDRLTRLGIASLTRRPEVQ